MVVDRMRCIPSMELNAARVVCQSLQTLRCLRVALVQLIHLCLENDDPPDHFLRRGHGSCGAPGL
eukprot:2614670-Lingulodinium_polyedra.AAC.1